MASVALICTANRCRSMMAHAIFVAEAAKRSLDVDIYSAGVFDFSDAPPLMQTTITCSQHNTPPPKESPSFVAELPLDSINRFLVMEQFHTDVLVSEFGIAANRITLLGTFDPKHRGEEIDDPFGKGAMVYESCYKLIRDCIVAYLETTESEPPA